VTYRACATWLCGELVCDAGSSAVRGTKVLPFLLHLSVAPTYVTLLPSTHLQSSSSKANFRNQAWALLSTECCVTAHSHNIEAKPGPRQPLYCRDASCAQEHCPYEGGDSSVNPAQGTSQGKRPHVSRGKWCDRFRSKGQTESLAKQGKKTGLWNLAENI
jgi:hypothetical protein